MIVSQNWLKKFIDNLDMQAHELAVLIGARLVEIEETIDLGIKYDGILVVKAVDVKKLDGSDHLNIVKIDDGGKTQDVERDANGLIQVVCGAPNIASNQNVVWLPPKTIVPESRTKSESFVIGVRELKGVKSTGMIASGKELDLSDDHDGILVIDQDIDPGTNLSEIYELNDYLFDIENKSLTHRPDTFGIIGFAREVAAISNKSFHTPSWLNDFSPLKPNQSKVTFTAIIDEPKLCPRYEAAVVSGADNSRKSPELVQTYLNRVGMRPINAVVDVTNYLMMLTGQPLHAFDYDKLLQVGNGKVEIHVRAANDGEELQLLDGKTIKMSSEDIVIANGQKAVALAGAMGGIDTAIDENTKNIIIESATFNLYNLRSTQMRHGIFSEAITRFTKGQPAALTAPVLNDAIKKMKEWAGAELVSEIVDTESTETETIAIDINYNRINAVLGTSYSVDEISKTLKNVEFDVEINGDNLKIIVPYWRADIHIEEDIIEEIGRINGFDNITPSLPKRNFVASRPTDYAMFTKAGRDCLSRAGLNEVLTYSFIHGDILEKAIQDKSKSYRIVNSISPDLQYYRQSITPSLLNLVHPNIKNGYDKFGLFEINKTNFKDYGLNDEGVPVEADMLSIVITDKNQSNCDAFYQARKILDFFCKECNLNLKIKPIDRDYNPIAKPFDEVRCGVIIGDDNDCVGIIGEYKKSVIRGFKLPGYTAGFEINLEKAFKYMDVENVYKPLSKYPSIERDVCFKIDQDIIFEKLNDAIHDALNNIDNRINIDYRPIDIYQSEKSETKNITFRFKINSYDRTLTNDDANKIFEPVINDVINKTSAQIV